LNHMPINNYVFVPLTTQYVMQNKKTERHETPLEMQPNEGSL